MSHIEKIVYPTQNKLIIVEDEDVQRTLYRKIFDSTPELQQYRLLLFTSYSDLLLCPEWTPQMNISVAMEINEVFLTIAPHIAGAVLDLKLPKIKLPDVPQFMVQMESRDFSGHLYTTQAELQQLNPAVRIAPRILITGSDVKIDEDTLSPGELYFAKLTSSMRDILKIAAGIP